MAAAMAIAILIALTVMIVRVAGVIMRLTGLPENIARFQALSALTGTGFTTGESEMIVNHPIRRRVLIALMIIGHLGFVALGSTFIVALINASDDSSGLFVQSMIILAAVIFVFILTMFKPLDSLMCEFAEKLLLKTTSLGRQEYKRVLQLEDNFSIVEHIIAKANLIDLEMNSDDPAKLKFIGVRRGPDFKIQLFSENVGIKDNDILVCFGNETAHDAFSSIQHPTGIWGNAGVDSGL